MKDLDKKFMEEALREAKLGFSQGEVPVGAVIVCDGEIIARAHNLVEREKSSLMHSEIIAIDKATKALGDWRLSECTMYVTLEPCSMCAGAIVNSRIKRLVIGAMDEKRGCCGSIINIVDDGAFNHRVILETGLLGEESSKLLKDFFRKLREGKKD